MQRTEPSFIFSELAYHEISDILSTLRPEDIRPIDYLEFSDAAKDLGFQPSGKDFRPLMCAMLGMIQLKVRSCFIAYEDEPVFLATSTNGVHPYSAVKTVCGFGWDAADKKLSNRLKWKIGKLVANYLLLDDPHCNEWQCFVHKDNKNTLQSWEYVGKYYSDELVVTFSQGSKPDYLTVHITRKKDS